MTVNGCGVQEKESFMGVDRRFHPRDDRAERYRGPVIPWVENAYLQSTPIKDSYNIKAMKRVF